MSEIYVIHDPTDRVAHRDHLQSLADPRAGVLLSVVTPGVRSTKGLVADLLAGLGKRPDVGAHFRHRGERWPTVISWLVAEGITSVIVARAHLLDGRAWQVLCELSAICGFDLYLVVQRGSLSRGQRYQTERWPTTLFSWEEFRDHWTKAGSSSSVSTAEAMGGPESFPQVPRSEFTTFRADCRRTLTAEEFAVVDAERARAREATRTWLAEFVGPVTEEDLSDHMRQLISNGRNLDQMLARLRGAQCELFFGGYLVKLCLDTLAAAVATLSLPDLNEESADRLRAYVATTHPAAAALALGAGFDPHEIVAINIGDVAADGARVDVAESCVEVAPVGRALLKAHRLFRLMEGGRPEEPLFLSEIRQQGPKTYKRTTAQGMHAVLKRASREVGVILLRRHVRPQVERARRWTERRGISVQLYRPQELGGASR